MEKIAWITPDYFIETDAFIVPDLSEKYYIDWFVIYTGDINNISQKDKIDNIQDKKNLSVHFVKQTKESPFSLRNYKFYYNLIKTVKLTKAKVIYSAVLNYPYSILAYLMLGTKRVIYAAHNVNTPKGVDHYNLVRLYNGFAWRSFKNFQVFSMSQYNLLNRLYKKKNVFYAPFVLKDYGVPTIQPNNVITFLFFGRIKAYKSPEILIRAAQKVKERTSIPFHVIIAGACSEWEKYDKEINDRELFTLLIHAIEDKDIPNLFGQSHYAVFPYQDIAQSGALFVAVNYNKPAILSDLPAFKEVIECGKNGFFVKQGDVSDLADKMLYVINNHNEIYPMLVQNMENLKSERYNPQNIVKKYCDFIDSLIK